MTNLLSSNFWFKLWSRKLQELPQCTLCYLTFISLKIFVIFKHSGNNINILPMILNKNKQMKESMFFIHSLEYLLKFSLLLCHVAISPNPFLACVFTEATLLYYWTSRHLEGKWLHVCKSTRMLFIFHTWMQSFSAGSYNDAEVSLLQGSTGQPKQIYLDEQRFHGTAVAEVLLKQIA